MHQHVKHGVLPNGSIVFVVSGHSMLPSDLTVPENLKPLSSLFIGRNPSHHRYLIRRLVRVRTIVILYLNCLSVSCRQLSSQTVAPDVSFGGRTLAKTAFGEINFH